MNKENVTKSFSNKIMVLSFFMAVFVVFIHANNLKYYGLENALGSFPYVIVKIFSEVIGGIAVPFFFMISGFWFFHMDIHSNDVWDYIKIKEYKK